MVRQAHCEPRASLCTSTCREARNLTNAYAKDASRTYRRGKTESVLPARRGVRSRLVSCRAWLPAAARLPARPCPVTPPTPPAGQLSLNGLTMRHPLDASLTMCSPPHPPHPPHPLLMQVADLSAQVAECAAEAQEAEGALAGLRAAAQSAHHAALQAQQELRQAKEKLQVRVAAKLNPHMGRSLLQSPARLTVLALRSRRPSPQPRGRPNPLRANAGGPAAQAHA